MAYLIRFEDGSYNSGTGEANGFPVVREEATRYATLEEAEAKLTNLCDAVIEEEPDEGQGAAGSNSTRLYCQPVKLRRGGEGEISLISFELAKFAGQEVDVIIIPKN